MEKKQYELLYVIPAKYTEGEVKSIMDKMKGIVEAGGASVSEMHNLGKRRLAYPINHVRFGNYALAWFEAEASTVAKLNETLRLTEEVLRHLITVRDMNLKKIPSFAEEEPRLRRDEMEERPRVASRPSAPIQAPAIPAAAVSGEELDKKLDALLNEKVL
jgi:small subunit ribosomal protein S6